MNLNDLTVEVRAALQKLGADTDAFMKGQKDKYGDVDKRLVEVNARIHELEQKAVRAGSGDGGNGSFGGAELRAVIENSAELKAMAERKVRNVVLELPKGYFSPRAAITSTGIAFPDQ